MPGHYNLEGGGRWFYKKTGRMCTKNLRMLRTSPMTVGTWCTTGTPAERWFGLRKNPRTWAHGSTSANGSPLPLRQEQSLSCAVLVFSVLIQVYTHAHSNSVVEEIFTLSTSVAIQWPPRPKGVCASRDRPNDVDFILLSFASMLCFTSFWNACIQATQRAHENTNWNHQCKFGNRIKKTTGCFQDHVCRVKIW